MRQQEFKASDSLNGGLIIQGPTPALPTQEFVWLHHLLEQRLNFQRLSSHFQGHELLSAFTKDKATLDFHLIYQKCEKLITFLDCFFSHHFRCLLCEWNMYSILHSAPVCILPHCPSDGSDKNPLLTTIRYAELDA